MIITIPHRNQDTKKRSAVPSSVAQMYCLSYRQQFNNIRRNSPLKFITSGVEIFKHKPKHCCLVSLQTWHWFVGTHVKTPWTLDLGRRPATGAAVRPPAAASCACSLVWPIHENSCRQLWGIQSFGLLSCVCTAAGHCALLPFSVHLLPFPTLKWLLLAACNFWLVLHCKC